MLSDLNANRSSITQYPPSTVVNNLVGEAQACGAPAWSYSWVSNLLTFGSPDDITNAANYANAVGVNAILLAGNRLIAQQQKNNGGGGSGDAQLQSDCNNYKKISDLMVTMAFLYGGASALGCAPCFAMGLGLGFMGAFLRLMSPC